MLDETDVDDVVVALVNLARAVKDSSLLLLFFFRNKFLKIFV